MCYEARNQEERHRNSQNDPQESCPDIIAVIGYAVESAGVRLIFDDEFLKDERFGESDDRAVDAIDVALEGYDSEDEGQHRWNDQRRAHRKHGIGQWNHEVR